MSESHRSELFGMCAAGSHKSAVVDEGRDCRGCEKCGGQGKKTQVSESSFHLVVLLRIGNPTPSLAVGWEAI